MKDRVAYLVYENDLKTREDVYDLPPFMRKSYEGGSNATVDILQSVCDEAIQELIAHYGTIVGSDAAIEDWFTILHTLES